MIIHEGYYNYNTQCYSSNNDQLEMFYFYKDKTPIVYVNGEIEDVLCVNVKYVDNLEDNINQLIYQSSFWCAVIGFIAAIIILLCICCWCTDWCRCCFCQEVKYSQIAAEQVVLLHRDNMV
ncbi:Hypothetical_protein [Hexamita inflata]|uniref:Hypothetical_protein n=1 Tax=Hexamita inflata TaxID=28002 RepID=A0AA86QAE4_9EUKA|nr:Hypothetical protein HINF_LOCUS36130 [Hexamita inflata]